MSSPVCVSGMAGRTSVMVTESLDYRLTSAISRSRGSACSPHSHCNLTRDPATATAVPVDDLGQDTGRDVLFAPVGQRGQHRQQIEPGVGQRVLLPRPGPGHLIGPGWPECPAAVSRRSRSDSTVRGAPVAACISSKRAHPERDLANDEQRPPLAHHLEDARQTIDHSAESRPCTQLNSTRFRAASCSPAVPRCP